MSPPPPPGRTRSLQGECSHAAAPRCFGADGECKEHVARARHALSVPGCHFLCTLCPRLPFPVHSVSPAVISWRRTTASRGTVWFPSGRRGDRGAQGRRPFRGSGSILSLSRALSAHRVGLPRVAPPAVVLTDPPPTHEPLQKYHHYNHRNKSIS